MFVSIDTSDFQQFETVMDRLEKRFADVSPFWNDFALGLVQDRVRAEFRTEGHGQWPALDPAYAAEKAREFPGRGILEKRRVYFRAATVVGHPGNVFMATPTEMVYGVDGDYFILRYGENYPAVHELGRGVPQRAVFEEVSEDAQLDSEIARLLEKWAADEVEQVERGRP